jgi:hypothetical protein
MSLILRWGLAAGLVIVLVDAAAGELTRSISDGDLAAAVELVDLLVNLALLGWVGYQVAGALGELRNGLEAAVLAGLIAGLGGVAYHLVRGAEPTTPTDAVALIAWNIVLAAASGALGAWVGSAVRRDRPPGRDSS